MNEIYTDLELQKMEPQQKLLKDTTGVPFVDEV